MEELGAVYYYKLWLGNMHFKVGLTPYCQMKEGIGSLKASWMLRAWGSEVQSLRKGRQRNQLHPLLKLMGQLLLILTSSWVTGAFTSFSFPPVLCFFSGLPMEAVVA